MVKIIGLVPAASEVTLRPPEAIFVFVLNGQPCPVWNGSLLWAYRVTFDVENDRPGPGSLPRSFCGRPRPFLETEGIVFRL